MNLIKVYPGIKVIYEVETDKIRNITYDRMIASSNNRFLGDKYNEELSGLVYKRSFRLFNLLLDKGIVIFDGTNLKQGTAFENLKKYQRIALERDVNVGFIYVYGTENDAKLNWDLRKKSQDNSEATLKHYYEFIRDYSSELKEIEARSQKLESDNSFYFKVRTRESGLESVVKEVDNKIGSKGGIVLIGVPLVGKSYFKRELIRRLFVV